MIQIVATFTEKFAWEVRVNAHHNKAQNFGKFTSQTNLYSSFLRLKILCECSFRLQTNIWTKRQTKNVVRNNSKLSIIDSLESMSAAKEMPKYGSIDG